MTLAAGERFPSAYLPHVFYQFPEFQEAKITWTDFSSARYPLKMNYNLFISRMDVIDENGETVKQKKCREARILNFDGSIFYPGLMEIIVQSSLGLAVRKNFALVEDKDRLENAGFSDQAHASLMSNKVSISKYDRLYQLNKTYYFMDKKNQFHKASKLTILKLMPRDREKIIAFMNENNTSFNDAQDLMNLISYCNQLRSAGIFSNSLFSIVIRCF